MRYNGVKTPVHQVIACQGILLTSAAGEIRNVCDQLSAHVEGPYIGTDLYQCIDGVRRDLEPLIARLNAAARAIPMRVEVRT